MDQFRLNDPNNIKPKKIIYEENQPHLISYRIKEIKERIVLNEEDYIEGCCEEYQEDIMEEKVSYEEDKPFSKMKTWFEKDMHPLLVKYLKESSYFRAYAKTIDQSASSNLKRGLNEWDHPDIVAVEAEMYLNFDNEVNNFLKNTNQSYMKIYSFELKQNITLGTLRKYYFQAVSNSTWANEGYLVAMSIEEKNEEDIMEELKRLNNSFGIGVIILDKNNLQKSKITFRLKA